MLAANLLMPLAEEGHAEAMHQLAIALRASGEFGEEVVFLLQQAVEGGSREALSDFVGVIDDADNPARYAESAFQQLQLAAKLGEASAWMPLGERHEHGNGTVPDIKLALAAYEKAKALGDPRAGAKLSAKQGAMDRAVAFIRSWNEVSVATLLDHVAAGQGKFFMLDHAPMDALLRLEEQMRVRWPLRRISVAAGAKAEPETFDRIQVSQPFQFEVQRGERIARGKGVLACTVQRDEDDKWRITDADDTIELTELLPAKEQFVSAVSLRELKPAFTHDEQLEESRLEILRGMRGIEDTQDFKVPLTVLMNAVYEFPQETFWKPFADTLCDRMARQLFADGKWLDAAWAEPVHQLAERGSVSAMLLEGHLLAAGYGFQRDEKRSTALYQQAFEVGKRRDARFYYAEALFQGRGVPQDIPKAGALVLSFMSRSKHPLEAYLAAHLLWRKAEIDPSLWQQVYDTLSRVADKHPPAKNLAGMVLLNHGQTTKERKTGFAAIKAAAEEGVVEAMKTLASCYQDGIGCEKDFLTSTTWKQKAAVTPPLRRRHYTEFEE
jgi:TPR repeat protein